MKIKDVAERSGFSAPTLRYYEEIGLVPPPARTSAGYRTYDEGTIERLAFIARAKQLGCTLEEIADLTTAWEGGSCGPIQDRLRTLVAGKLALTQQQIVELTTLAGELRRSAAALELHRPDGACDDDCGCISDPAAAAVAVSLGAKPIVCTLDAAALPAQLDDWRRLLTQVTTRVAIDRGVRLELAAEASLAELARLVAAEQGCCQFLEFAITVDERGTGLEVRGPADARGIIDALFGVPA